MILSIFTIPYPHIDPVFLRLGPVQLRWYGLMYMISFIIGFFALRRLAKRRKLNLSNDDLYDLLFYMILGVMVGGRLGYVLLYDLSSYMRDPLSIFAIWQGGMSFHGGFVGMFLAALYITRKKGWHFMDVADLVSAAAPIGIGLVRIGNFINGELFGRPTNVAWAMVFPEGGSSPRHPSQLYEAILEGLVLFFILQWLYRKNFHRGTVFWAFLAFYGLFRFSVEFLREPDAQIGFDLGPFTRGQELTFPMLVLGMVMMIRYARRPKLEFAPARRRGGTGHSPSKSRTGRGAAGGPDA
jgi:phosphatidylglycerol:prolipoprotein diacylglycerol transferase